MMRACDNPFAVHRVLRQRYRLDEAGWAGVLARLGEQRGRGAIVGPHGAGKTTLLEDLGQRLAAQGWHLRWVRLSRELPRISSDQRRAALTKLGARDLVLLDGAEQLSSLAWWRVRWQTRHAGGLIVTTHTEGRLPTVWRCATTPDLLRTLVHELDVCLDEADARALHARHQGNVRDALRELYDRAASGAPQNSIVVVNR
jgi:thymidylate kinase